MERRRRFGAVLVTLLATACGSAGAGGKTAEVPVGTALTVRLENGLDTNRDGPGTVVTGTLSQPVTDGVRVLIPAGAVLRGEVVEFSENPPRLSLAFHELQAGEEVLILEAELASVAARRQARMKDKGKKIGGGAAAGAVLGGVIGGNAKGAVAGAAAGAAAGTGVALATKDVHAYVPAGTTVRVRLDRPLEVHLPEEPSGQS